MDMWAQIDAERAAFADLADSLTPEQWDAPSLCTEWRVRDVVAHVTQGATIGLGESLRKMVRYGFRLDKLLTEEAKKGGAAPTDELRANLRATIGARSKAPGVKPVGLLADEVVHQQDVRRAIGVPHAIPPVRVGITLHDLTTDGIALIPTKKWSKGLHLRATDLDWETGPADGAEVAGPAEALMMALAGRPVALAELSGGGVEQLRERISR
jgi:uncharacterized protein (TIGR03083 family)